MSTSPPNEFKRLLNDIGWTVPRLAVELDVSGPTAYCWSRGKTQRGEPTEAPASVIGYLRRVLAAQRGVPKPAYDLKRRAYHMKLYT